MIQGSERTRRRRPSLLYAVKQVELIVRSRLDEVLRDSGITALQYTALTVLARRDGLTSAELARNSFVTPQAMADLVTALERGRHIERRRDPDNRRQLLISLTPTGQELLARYAGPVAAIEERMVAELDDDARERFRGYLDTARAALADGAGQERR